MPEAANPLANKVTPLPSGLVLGRFQVGSAAHGICQKRLACIHGIQKEGRKKWQGGDIKSPLGIPQDVQPPLALQPPSTVTLPISSCFHSPPCRRLLASPQVQGSSFLVLATFSFPLVSCTFVRLSLLPLPERSWEEKLQDCDCRAHHPAPYAGSLLPP